MSPGRDADGDTSVRAPSGDDDAPDGTLRIVRAHIRGECVYSLLSDGRLLRVPMSVAPGVADAPHNARYQWRVVDEGRAMVWGVGANETRVTVDQMMSHPGAEIVDGEGSGPVVGAD